MTTATRHLTPDALRGFAVMGILAANIIAFAMPEMAYVNPAVMGELTASDRISWLAQFVLIDGKMRGLFSLLFGASMMLIADTAAAKGEDPARVHYRRMAWLGLFGAAHFFLIWFGDILFYYAVIGAIAFRARAWEPRRLIKWALVLYTLFFLANCLFYGALLAFEWAANAPGASAAMVAQYQEMMSDPAMSGDISEDLAVYTGGYGAIVAHRLNDWLILPLNVLLFIGETLPLMWLGMALMKNGFMTGVWDAAAYRRWAWRLVPAGLALNLALGLYLVSTDFAMLTMLNGFMAWSAPMRLMLTIGYASLLILLIQRHATSGFIARVAAAGQVAFTNYLGTSIVMTSLFYGYGLGLFGQVDRTTLWLFVLGGCAVMLLWSQPWLARYRYGPLEWLWRSLARGAVQPMRR